MLNTSDSHKVSGIITQRGFKRLSPRLIQTVEASQKCIFLHKIRAVEFVAHHLVWHCMISTSVFSWAPLYSHLFLFTWYYWTEAALAVFRGGWRSRWSSSPTSLVLVFCSYFLLAVFLKTEVQKSVVFWSLCGSPPWLWLFNKGSVRREGEKS